MPLIFGESLPLGQESAYNEFFLEFFFEFFFEKQVLFQESIKKVSTKNSSTANKDAIKKLK